MPTSLPPRSGQQYSLHHGDYAAVVTEIGATLRRLTYQGDDVIVPWDSNEAAPCCNGQLLVPFPNRIEDGEYAFDGSTYELPIDEHERRNAIHGYGYRSYWTLEGLEEDRVTLWWRVPDMLGYPFDLVVTAEYQLADDGLHLHVSATNRGGRRAPWALAIHPWLANGLEGYGDEIDRLNARCRVTIPADTHVTVNERLLPTGTEPVDGTKYDLREGRLLTQQPYDDAWTDVHHAGDGTVAARFERPDGRVVSVGGDESITSFQMCTGTGFPESRHPCGVAIEPQTAYANAFNTGKDLIVIEPGEGVSTVLFIRVEQQ
ncbi:aldose 1-epimerase family protein [Bifidobacterium sp.]|jgi:aldose 1-epimerase|uniref:aldose 1-epimerase family protein n=1 Tax=Bifidobacterium sp. TaxID=41200 RepID=UPI0025C42D7C|nr:aldose 1-epimerase family protein [Bifidobacterium sp.]MCH4209322.1 aldose 1-epimerase family protein [Bifidobacterium sp.]MCI1224116.1 aldose 1-epimerase family protein [Bifidobacterium sp.]